jgi:hypothetical protein
MEKWGIAALPGFQLVPNVLFRAQRHLGLDSVDVVILLNIALHWWGPGRLPFPSPGIIANRMGVSRRTVERRIARLEERGFLRRLPPWGNDSRVRQRPFEMTGLVTKLEEAATVAMLKRERVRSSG